MTVGILTPQRVGQAVDDLVDVQLERVPHTPLLAWCWALRHNLTMYDAAYIAVAEHLGIPLLTADAGLAGAPGLQCNVELLTSSA